MRCLALGQAVCAAGGCSNFAMAEECDWITERLREEEIPRTVLGVVPGSREDASATLAEADRCRADWVVVDGYHFDEVFQKPLFESGKKLMVMDDDGSKASHDAHLILNQNPGASTGLYPNRPRIPRLLFGGQFALLRREFMPWRESRRRASDQVSNLIVTMGGGDDAGLTGEVLQALAPHAANGLGIHVVVGRANSRAKHIRASAPPGVNLLEEVADLPALMARADLVVAAAGSTCWELCLLGVPMIVLVADDNQEAVARPLAEAGAAINLGRWQGRATADRLADAMAELLHDSARREAMAKAGRALIDGRGGERVVKVMQEMCHAN
jgi:UDP-2,4-diacetamido-2,4,6-trideoxy-beta-L-altropyranose hydrolase